GDGKADLVEIRRESDAKVTATTWLTTETGLVKGETTDISANNPYRARYYLADLSGDGKADLIAQWDNAGTTYHTEWTLSGKGFVRDQESRSWGALDNHLQTLTLDNNADGRQDVARTFKYNSELWVGINQRTVGGLNNYSEMKLDAWNETSRFFAADVNGDGKQDLIQVYTGADSNTHVRHWVSNGLLFTSGQDVSIGEVRPGAHFLVGDLNADGKPDLVQIWQSTDKQAMAQILRATASGYSGVSSSVLGTWHEDAQYRLVRQNGDNRPDLVGSWQESDGRWTSTVWRQQAMPNRFMPAITQTSVAGDAFQSTAVQFAAGDRDTLASSAIALAGATKDAFNSSAEVTKDAFGTNAAQFAAPVKDVFATTVQQFEAPAADQFTAGQSIAVARDVRFSTSNSHVATSAGFNNAWYVSNPVADGVLGGAQVAQPSNRPMQDDSILEAVRAHVGITSRSVGVQHLFDVAGREVFTLSVDGMLTERQYDATGKMLRESHYATPILSSSPLTLAEVQARLAILPKTTFDRHVYVVYDLAGRERYRIGADRAVSSIDYDAAGRIVRRTRFAQALPGNIDLTQPLTLVAVAQAMTGGDHTQDQIERQGYDAAGRPIYSIDGMGYVTERRFDGAGNEIGRRAHAGRADLAVWDAEQRLTTDGVQTVLRSHAFYDAANRLVVELDGEGYVTRRVYDVSGQLIQRIRYGTALNVADSADLATVLSKLPVKLDNLLDGVERYVYDTAGRLAITIDGIGRVRRSVYDAMGRVVRTIQYAKIAADRLNLADYGKPAAADRVTDVVYDESGRVRYTIDPEGVVIEQRYDYLDHVTQTIRHQQRVSTRPYDVVELNIKDANSKDRTLFDPALAFSRTQNPNGQWQYGFAGKLGDFTRFEKPEHNGQGFDLWRQTTTTHPFIAHNSSDQRITWSSSWLDAKQMSFHPGATDKDRFAILRFVVPSKGTYSLNVQFFANDQSGTTSDAYVLLNGKQLFGSDVTRGLNPITDQIIELNEGDTLDFAVGVGPNGNYNNDLTGIALRLWQGSPTLLAGQGAINSAAALYALTQDLQASSVSRERTHYFYDETGRMRYGVDPEGRVTHYRYDSFGQLIGSIVHADRLVDSVLTLEKLEAQFANADSQDRISRVIYDVAGRERFRIDTLGYVIETRYNNQGQRSEQIAYAKAVKTDEVLDAATVIKALQLDAADRHTTYRYDASGRLSEQTTSNKTERFTYNAAGLLVTRTDGLLHQWQQRYDQRGLLVETSNDAGEMTRYGYNAAGLRESMTDGNKYTALNLYDQAGQVVASLDGKGQAERYQYDAFGNRIETIDRLGARTRYEYDKGNRVIRQFNADDHFKLNQYDDRGNLVMQQVDLGLAANQSTQVINGGFEAVYVGNYTFRPTDPAWRYENNAGVASLLLPNVSGEGKQGAFIQANSAISQTLELRSGAYLRFKAAQHPQTIKDQRFQILLNDVPQGEPIVPPYGEYGEFVIPLNVPADGKYTITIRSTWADVPGHISAQVDDVRIDQPAVATTVNRYDSSGRLLASVNAEGEVTTYEYDTFGNRVASVRHAEKVLVSADSRTSLPGVDAADEVTRYSYDRAGRLETITNALKQVSRHEYDGFGNVVRSTDTGKQVSQQRFNVLNQLLESTDALGHRTVYEYDAAGNRIRSSLYEVGSTVPTVVNRYRYDAANRLVEESIDGVAGSTVYGYDNAGNKISVTDGKGYTTRYTYDANRRLETQTDGEGNVTRYGYDAVGNRTRITNGAGQTTNYRYDNLRQLVEEIDANQISVKHRYDAVGNRIADIDGNGNTVQLRYDLVNRLVGETSARTVVTRYQYDSFGNLRTKQRGNAERTISWRYDYDLLNRQTAEVSGEGYRTEYGYDAAGNRTIVRKALDQSASQWQVTRQGYDALGREAWRLQSGGQLTRTRYDAQGNVASRTVYGNVSDIPGSEPVPRHGDSGLSVSYRYNGRRQLVSETGVDGQVTTYGYDAAGNLQEKIEFSGTAQARRTAYEYDKANRKVRETDAFKGDTRYAYDGANRIITRTEVAGHGRLSVTHLKYDSVGNLVRQEDALGNVVIQQFDNNHNLKEKREADGTAAQRITTYRYDADNQVIEINGSGSQQQLRYDAFGNKIEVRLGGDRGPRNLFRYDNDQRLIQSTDGNGVEATYRYDGVGNRLEKVEGSNQGNQARLIQVRYDAANRVSSETNALGYTTSYTYDDRGNRASVTVGQYLLTPQDTGYDAAKAALAKPTTTHYTYDAAGRVLTMLTAGGRLTRNQYDAAGNLVSSTLSRADGQDARTTRYRYDLLGRSTHVIDAEGFGSLVEYDEAGQKTRVSSGVYLLQAGDNGYDAAKAARAATLGTRYEYDLNGQVTAEVNGAGDRTEYRYDGLGNRIAKIQAAGTVLARTTTYQYDNAGRLVETITPEGGRSKRRYHPVFADKIVAEDILQGINSNGQEVWLSRTYGYDAAMHQVSDHTDAGLDFGYSHDVFGNQTDKWLSVSDSTRSTESEGPRVAGSGLHVVHVEYDALDRKLSETDADNHTNRFRYDSRGNLIWQQDALGRVSRFYYDQDGLLVMGVEATGAVTRYQYDVNGNKLAARQFATLLGTPVADLDDFLAPVVGEQTTDRLSQWQYDLAGQVRSETQPDGSRTDFIRDGVGQVLEQRAYANTTQPRITQLSYDAAGRLQTQLEPTGLRTTLGYDAAGNKVRQETVDTRNPSSAARITTWEYDRDNRQITEVTDPAGLKLMVRAEYDKVGNLVAHIDGVGRRSEFRFDRYNRQIEQRDGAGNLVSSVSYDARGRVQTVSDAKGTVSFTYDDLNRKLTETRQVAWQSLIGSGSQVLIRYQYDAVGNVVQLTQPDGARSTRYYDEGNRLVAELDVDQVLHRYRYNAYGQVTEETIHLTRLDPSAHNPQQQLTTPPGESRLIRRDYDLAGRVTRVRYPDIMVTELIDRNRVNPGVRQTVITPEESHVYNAYGEDLDSRGKDGRRTLQYFDAAGRVVAKVDAAGYLTELDYDASGNVLQQRAYLGQLDLAGLNLNQRPTGVGGVAITDFRFDVAGRLVEQLDPARDVADSAGNVRNGYRPKTVFSYNAAGQLTHKAMGADSSNTLHSWQYFDTAGQMVGTIDQKRMLTLFTYDARGNKTAEQKMGRAVAQEVDLSTLTGDYAALHALVSGPSNNWTINYVYDAANRLIEHYEQAQLVNKYAYDAMGNRTYTQDAMGRTTNTVYDAKGRQIKTIGVDGSGTVARYDAEGNRTFVYTGEMPNQATLPKEIRVEQGVALQINWLFSTPIIGGRSWVVYGPQSNVDIDAYPGRTGEQLATEGQHVAEVPKPASGTQVYFRIVSQDAAGNLSWSEEKVLTVAPQYDKVEVYEVGNGTLRYRIHFEDGVNDPVIHVHGSATPLILKPTGDGYYQAEGEMPHEMTWLSYVITWRDASGKQQTGIMQTLSRIGQRASPSSAVSHEVVNPAIGNAAEFGYKLVLDTGFDARQLNEFQLVLAEIQMAGSTAIHRASALVKDVASNEHYSLVVGSTSDMLAAGQYDIRLKGMRADGSVVDLDRFNYVLTPLPAPAVGSDPNKPITSEVKLIQHLSWRNPHNGFTGQWVIVNKQLRAVTQQGDSTIMEGNDLVLGDHYMEVYYTQQIGQRHQINVNTTQATHLEEIKVPDGYQVDLSCKLSESQRQKAKAVYFALQPDTLDGTTSDFMSSNWLRQALELKGDRFTGQMTHVVKGNYRVALFSVDAEGKVEVLQTGKVPISANVTFPYGGPLDQRITTAEQFRKETNQVPTPDTYHLDYVVTLTQEELASIQGKLKVSYYAEGKAKIETLDMVAEGNVLKARLPDLKGKYEIKVYYQNADGRTVIVDWRQHEPKNSLASEGYSAVILGKEQDIHLTKDVNGLHVALGSYLGPQAAAKRALEVSVLPTGFGAGQRLNDGRLTGYYLESRYDAAGNKIASNETDGIWREYGVDQAGNAVLTQLYDKAGGAYQGNQLAEFDGRGRKVAEWGAAYTAYRDGDDPTATVQRQHIRYRYHRNDQIADQVTLLGDVGGNLFDEPLDPGLATRQRTVFDAVGQKLATTDAMGNTVRYQYDEAGRLVATIDARGYRSSNRYDASGNLVEEIDAVGARTQYQYDDWGRRIIKRDALGRETSYGWLGDRLIRQGNLEFSYDAVGNRRIIRENGIAIQQDHDAMNRVIAVHTWENGVEKIERRAYDVYGNLVGESKGDDWGKAYWYGGFNRLQRMNDETGLVTYYEYDGLGRQIREHNAEGKDIRKAYDAAGHLLSVTDLATGSQTTYRYDLAGRKVHERFDGQGQSRDLRYEYDASGRQIAWRDRVTQTGSRSELDGNGNLTRIWHDGMGPWFDRRYEFDGNNRVTRESHGDGRLVHAFHYDGVGNRVEDNDGGRVVHYRYDAQNRVVAAQWYGSVQVSAAAAGFTDLNALSSMLGITDHHADSIQLQGGQQTLTLPANSRVTLRNLAQTHLGDANLWQRISILGWYRPADNGPRFNRHGVEIPATTTNTASILEPVMGEIGPDSELGEGIVIQFNLTLRDLARVHYGNEAGWTELAQANGLSDPDAVLATGTQLKAPHLWQMSWEYDTRGNVTSVSQGYGWYYAKRSLSQYDGANRKIHGEEQALVKVSYPISESFRSQDFDNRWQTRTNWQVGYALGTEQRTDMRYDSQGRLAQLTTRISGSLRPNTATYLALGRRNLQQTQWMSADDKDYVYNYRYTADGRASGISGYGPKGGNGSTAFYYNANRQLIRQVQGQGDGMERGEQSTFVYDNDGHILHKWHDSGRKDSTVEVIHYLYANGQAVGETGQYTDGSIKTLIEDGRFARIETLNRDFPSGTVSSYTAKGGENLRQVAGSVWGNPALWYLIADANGLRGDSELQAGQKLTLPPLNRSDTVNSDSFRVYREDEIIGNQTPNIQTPPPKKKCGGFGMILMIVVAVVVTIFTAGAALAVIAPGMTAGMTVMGAGMAALGGSMGFAGIAAAAIGGFVGSVAAQGVGKLTGDVQHFSLRQAVLSGVASGLGAGLSWAASASGAISSSTTTLSGVTQGANTASQGLGMLGSIGNYAQMAMSAMVGNALTQRAAIHLKQQEHFSWRQVAVAGAAAPIAHALGQQLDGLLGIDRHINPLLQDGLKNGEVLSRLSTRLLSNTLTNLVDSAIQHKLHQELDRRGRYQGRYRLGDQLPGAVGNSITDEIKGYYTAGARQTLDEASNPRANLHPPAQNPFLIDRDPVNLPRNDVSYYQDQMAGGKLPLIDNREGIDPIDLIGVDGENDFNHAMQLRERGVALQE
ncbi:YD repeat-containing protein, partial [Chitinivorax tropicus]